MEKFGKYPVISISLKSIIAESKEEFKRHFASLMYEIYSKHLYLKDSLNDTDKKIFDDIYNKVENAEYENSLKFLTKILYNYYKEKAVILIDEYDAPIINALNSKDEDFIKEVSDFMGAFFGESLKGNDYLEFAIVTGILRITGQGLFSGFNNVTHRSVTDKRANEFYGFTEKEVKEALEYYELSDTLDGVKAWYDGYNFGGKEIYNPWSIIKYLNEKN